MLKTRRVCGHCAEHFGYLDSNEVVRAAGRLGYIIPRILVLSCGAGATCSFSEPCLAPHLFGQWGSLKASTDLGHHREW